MEETSNGSAHVGQCPVPRYKMTSDPRGHPDTETDVVLEQEKLIPGEADFLLAYSTVPGYVSFRDKTNGSHYIDKLVEILKKHAHELDILKILTLVNHELGCRDIFKEGDGHCKQSPAQLSTLRKDLYLSPIQLSSESIATAVPRFPDNEVRMALIGKTGNGKSSSGNTIFGVDKFPVCRGWGSCGDSCGWGLVEREGLRIQVADTPGLCDTERPQREVNRDIAECVRKTTPGPHVFLMVLNYATRFTEEEWKAYCDLKLLFGRDFNKHMIVLITHFDEVDDMGVCFEDELKNAPQNLQQIIAEAGGRYVVFNNVAGRDDRCQQSGRLLDMVADLIAANGGAFYSLRGLDSNGVVKDSSKKLSKKFGKGRGDRSSGKCSAM
ncbi:hypothetical protein BaRGS_00018336 [Batillaria attramentaria]|uniref:AIG1-type G domain-containing protein n=1 Tax=Batillaria attramentaria TaxID=370345 RepID=A0ABD0KT52_9CAEN